MSLIGIDVLHSSLVSKAVANIYRKPVCILSLSHKVGVGIEFSGDGEMKAKDCVVWSNARGVEALRFDGSGKVRSERLCAVGRAGSVGQFSVDPKPQSHCPPVADPLSSWVAPTVGLCTHTSLPDEWITGTTANLQPGVYCGGLRVDANKIKLHKGNYIIKDGPLILRGSSEISGKDVGIFLTGLDSYLDIDGRSEVDIRAASKGVMAGIAIAARGDVGDSKITGRSDLKIGGVIYLPNQNLSYQGESEIVAISPITTIIANSIKLGGEAYLEVANDRDKAIYAPIIETGGVVYLSE